MRALRRGVTLPEAFDEWFGQATSPNPEQRFFKATIAIKGLAMALGVSVPSTSAAYAVSTTDSQGTGAVSGQTTPRQTGAGQTGTGQTPTASSSSGPQGTMVLAESAAPPVSAEPHTHASGYGLSSSQPKVASVPSVPQFDTAANAPVDAPKRGKTLPMFIAAAVAVCAVGIGVVAVGGKNKGSTADAPMANSLPIPSAAIAEPVVPVVVPDAPIEGVKSAEPVAKPSAPDPPHAPMGNGGTPMNTGATSNKSAFQTKLVPLKVPPAKATRVAPNKGIYTND